MHAYLPQIATYAAKLRVLFYNFLAVICSASFANSVGKIVFTALGALVYRRHIPGGKIAIGITLATEKDGLISAYFRNNFCSTLRAQYAYVFCALFCKLTLGIISTSVKIAVATGTKYHVATTKFALKIRNNMLLVFSCFFL